ncbi:MAG: hypothetical protein NXI31_09405 [bacterium]|nr:hypothetical protein [bacterium]
MRSRSLASALLLFSALLPTALPAQGEFVNYEDPQVKPVTIAAVGSGPNLRRVALICNTPDNSVEIYSAAPPFAFLARVPVGLSPVTVRWNARTDRFYTCNYLGDSITCVRLETSGSATGGVLPVVERTTYVGDQPTDIVFVQDDTQAFIALEGRNGVAHVMLSDLRPISALVPLRVPMAQGPLIDHIVKMPRRIALLPDDRFYALNLMGGDIDSPPLLDMGLFVFDPNNPPTGTVGHFHSVPDIGSTNLGFAIDSTGSRMFVVSQIAQNDAAGVDAVAAQKTGFVQTWLKVLDLLPGQPGDAPAIAPEQVAGPGPKALWQSINLNRDYSQTTLTEVAAPTAIAQATDVALVEGPTGVERIVLAGFGSDKIVILTPDTNRPSGYAIQQIRLSLLPTPNDYSAVGPRGLALDARGQDPSSPVASRGLVWCVNRLDNSFAVINPWTGNVLARRALHHDPTPTDIRAGRKFLYSAWATSGSGMVACASCHIDARTDGLTWNLGNLDKPGPAIPAHFHDGDGEDTASMPDFPNSKGLMVTQTLQGLLNSLVEPYSMRGVATNAPYHWRGDKMDFPDFNEAFVRLQGMPDEPTIPGLSGLGQADMERYHRFINTIHHPPSPEQRKDRRLGGELGDPDDPDDGSGGLLGMKLFHIIPTVGSRSCVNCHSVPEGSSNTLTLLEKIDGMLGTTPQFHPIETAATRNLFQREIMIPNGFDQTDLSGNVALPVTGTHGLLHAGLFTFPNLNNSFTINDFIHRSFNFHKNTATNHLRKLAVTEFVRQFDSGTAPLIGVPWTIDPAAPDGTHGVLGFFETQAREANVGIAVYTRSGGNERGYWFDPRDGRYYEEGGTSSLDRAGLIALAGPVNGDNVVILQATPTGSERRVASLTGTAAVLTGPAPDGATIELLPMAPSTFWVGIPSLTANWDPNHPTRPFNWDTSKDGPEPVSMKSIRELQASLAGQFGLPANAIRHEAPRRFRVIGDHIRPGAKLVLAMAKTNPGQFPAQQVFFDLAPSGYEHNGRPIWETAEELDPMHTLAWLHGGYWSPGVAKVMLADYTGVPQLDATTWNRFAVAILNEDQTLGLAPAWQPLTLQDDR